MSACDTCEGDPLGQGIPRSGGAIFAQLVVTSGISAASGELSLRVRARVCVCVCVVPYDMVICEGLQQGEPGFACTAARALGASAPEREERVRYCDRL